MLVVDRIGLLVTNDPGLGVGFLGLVRDASVVVADGQVVSVGPAGQVADERIDVGGACVLPGFVDSHTPRFRRRQGLGVHVSDGRSALRRWWHSRDDGRDQGGIRR